MGRFFLGRTMVVANPVSQSGAGAEGADFVRRTLGAYASATDGFTVKLTTGPGDAVRIARSSTCYDTVIALGGDGTIHEVVNGLMKIDPTRRPRLAVIPLGSGNDYARTLSMAANAPELALGQILQGVTRRMDLGLVNGVYFDETLSFGLDAAIALDTMERRKKSGSHGTRLFMSSGVHVIPREIHPRPFEATFDGEPLSGASIVFAVQVGPYYGGGFPICPTADARDGLLDICYSEGSPSVPTALGIFAKARLGKHLHSKYLHFRQVRALTVEFGDNVPAQVDGERIEGSRFEVSCAHRALEVVCPTYRL